MSAYESFKTAGTVVCLSPVSASRCRANRDTNSWHPQWGDSSPLIIPSVRFRDLFIESILAATGGTASIAAPALDPSLLAGSVGDSVTATIVAGAATAGVAAVADDVLIEEPLDNSLKNYDTAEVVEAAGVRTIRVSLRFKHTTKDASLGFFRSSLHAYVNLPSVRSEA
jgi:hypothetical protein